MNVLVLNCGSSSAKFAVIDPADGRVFVSGLAQRIGSAGATLDWKRDGARSSKAIAGADHEVALRAVVELLSDLGLTQELGGIGHRVVHGGDRFSGSVPATPEVLRELEACTALAPLHNPPNLTGLRIAKELFPALPQVAVFDTAFHQTMPPRAYVYPVPYAWLTEQRVRRYGFHGTSHRFVSERALELLGRPAEGSALVTAHLGNGCSLTAVKDGKSVDTTMGLTPLEGVMMGTRSGSVDPAIIGHMAKATGAAPEKVLEALNRESGLLGVTGLSNDMRTVEAAAEEGNPRAQLALDLFCYLLAKSVAALVVPLGHLDALVFTGGIGENSPVVRGRVVEQLGFLGLQLDPELNAGNGRAAKGRITRGERPLAMVVPTDEEWMIARDTAEIVGRAPAGARR